jgi:Phage integrase family/Protein of unknown function (DUF3102)
MKRKNVRSLDTIAVNINQLERGNIIDIGDLLLEAKSQCERGDWLNWLHGEFDWSVDTAERYMGVAALNAKFRSLRNLKLAATTLYELVDYEGEEDLPAIIEELAKHASKTQLNPRDARRVIKIDMGRRQYGDRPDATLVKLVELDWMSGMSWYEKVVAALLEREPDTDETASALVSAMAAQQKAEEAKIEDDAEQEEVESILSARRGDVTRLGPEHRVDGRFQFQHHKNGVDVSFPVSDELQSAIDAMPKTNHETFLHTEAGEPRSAKSLGGDFREWCDKAGLPKHCALHGLRKGCLRILAEAGCNILELQSRSGHLTLSELQKYIDKADKRFAADRAAEKVIVHKANQKSGRKIAA